MATRLAIAFDPAVLSTAPTPVNLVHGPRKRSGPADIPCILGRGSHASAPAPSATVSLANRGGSALSENPVNGTPTSSVVLTLNGDKDGARESRASPPPTDRLRTRSHASACKITQALAGEDLLTHKPRSLDPNAYAALQPTVSTSELQRSSPLQPLHGQTIVGSATTNSPVVAHNPTIRDRPGPLEGSRLRPTTTTPREMFFQRQNSSTPPQAKAAAPATSRRSPRSAAAKVQSKPVSTQTSPRSLQRMPRTMLCTY